MTRTDQVGS